LSLTIACSTFSLVDLRTLGSLFVTLDTVFIDTPANSATSSIVVLRIDFMLSKKQKNLSTVIIQVIA